MIADLISLMFSNLDVILIIGYLTVYLSSDEQHQTTCSLVSGWFLTAALFATFGFSASIAFPFYWAMSAILCVVVAIRGAAIILWGSGAMLLLQMMMCIDTWLTGADQSLLYQNYWLLALVINMLIILMTYLHGKGIESVSTEGDVGDRVGHSDI